MRPPLTLVQPGTAPQSPVLVDPTCMTALHTAIQDAWHDGRVRGERTGHIDGWRAGLVCGLCWGCLTTALAAIAVSYLVTP